MGKVYRNEKQELLEELKLLYQMKDIDWLSYQITRNNVLTIHHIIKACNGGPLNKENSALFPV